jgi:hypothetical protein
LKLTKLVRRTRPLRSHDGAKLQTSIRTYRQLHQSGKTLPIGLGAFPGRLTE